MALLIDLNTGRVERSDMAPLDLALLSYEARYGVPWHGAVITEDDHHVGIGDLVICKDPASRFSQSMLRYASSVRQYFNGGEVSYV